MHTRPQVMDDAEVIHRGRKYDLVRIPRTMDGRAGLMEVVRHPGAVVVLALDGKGRVVLIRSERPATGRTLWELPAGTLEAGEDPVHAAARELEEEAGLRAGTVEPLLAFYSTPGMTDEWMRVFTARELIEVGQNLDEGERIEPRAVAVEEALAMIDRAEIIDAKTIAGLLFARRKGVL